MKKIKYLYYCGEMRTAIYASDILYEREDCDDHVFFVPYREEFLPVKIRNRRNFVYMCKGGKLKRFLLRAKMVLKAEHLVFLGIFYEDIRIPQLLLIPKFIMKKAAWIETTGDSYRWRNESITWLDRFYNRCRKALFKRFPLIAVTFPSNEVQMRRELANPDAKCVQLPLGTFEKDFKFYDGIKIPEYGGKGTIWVQVGHSGLQTGNHVKILKMLSKFKDNDIKVITVVTNDVQVLWSGHNYAGRPYQNAVIRAAKHFFGDKASVFYKPIDLESYIKYSANIDILIVDINRAAAIGNITRALYLGKKVFLPSGNEYYDFWKNNGFDIYDMNKIPEMTFEEFISPPKRSYGCSIEFSKPENFEGYWKNFYDELNKL